MDKINYNYAKNSYTSQPLANGNNVVQCNFVQEPLKFNSKIYMPELCNKVPPYYIGLDKKYEVPHPTGKVQDGYKLDYYKTSEAIGGIENRRKFNNIMSKSTVILNNDNERKFDKNNIDIIDDDQISYSNNGLPQYSAPVNQIFNEDTMPLHYFGPGRIQPTYRENFEELRQNVTDFHDQTRLYAPNGPQRNPNRNWMIDEEPREIIDSGNVKINNKGYYSYEKPINNNDFIIPEYLHEGFQCENQKDFDNMYLRTLESYAISICHYVRKHPDFKYWNEYWRAFERNLNKNGLDFNRLEESDADVAYSISKGETLSFRIRDHKNYIPLSVYTYVLCHECAHIADYKEIGHTELFKELMHLLEMAAYLLGYIKLDRYPAFGQYKSNNQPILSKDSIKAELLDAAYNLYNKSHNDFWSKVHNRIRRS